MNKKLTSNGLLAQGIPHDILQSVPAPGWGRPEVGIAAVRASRTKHGWHGPNLGRLLSGLVHISARGRIQLHNSRANAKSLLWGVEASNEGAGVMASAH